MLDSKFNLYDSPNVILHKSVKIIYFSWLEEESHGIFMNEGARVYFRSVYLILSNLQINVYVNFSLCQMKLLFAALYITWKYLINGFRRVA